MSNCPYKEYNYEVMVQAPEAEAISLLAQVMNSYKDLPPEQIAAIAEWFHNNYKLQQ